MLRFWLHHNMTNRKLYDLALKHFGPGRSSTSAATSCCKWSIGVAYTGHIRDGLYAYATWEAKTPEGELWLLANMPEEATPLTENEDL